VDARRAGHVALVLALAAVGAAGVFLLVAGIQKNAQIAQLRHDGVSVEVRVAECRGLLGGSGSNGAGYACWGTFTLAGQRYTEAIPGNELLTPGSRLRLVTIAGDPGVLAAPGVVANAHPSARVFILPAALFALLVAVAGALVLRRRDAQPALRSLPDLGGGTRFGEAVGGV
jgi:hypothetical protein